jgi:glycosyltransferase involved in cell wall biosynthesis
VLSNRVVTDGKFFALGQERFPFRGITYGTFEPRSPDGARYPTTAQMKSDFADMRAAGFTVVRTYTTPPDDLLDAASDWDLRVLAGVFYPDWRYLVGGSRRERQQVVRDARRVVREAASRFAGNERILALTLGNEIPADVLRWVGAHEIARIIAHLVDVVRDEDPDLPVTYANYPTAEYLPLEDLDFLTFNVFLEQQPAFRRYLTRLQHFAGDRPLVLGEIGLNATDGTPEGERRQAEVLNWQLETAIERGVAGACVFSWTDEWWVGDAAVEGWHFGLTRADRSPRPALAVAQWWNSRDVHDLDHAWPTISVVVCAYNAAATLHECLRHTCALDYPELEIIVVDDGSTDGTAAIARRYPRVRLVEIEHAGLSTARNVGFQTARGELVAYLDSDAYPSPEWPYFLARGLDAPSVGGVGGPNVPPVADQLGAHQVARAPGGPLHVLVGDERAEHIPGCNMAFRKDVLVAVAGFDPVYTSAGDDVDLCWRVLDRDWEIGFHPAALVWHHRRAGLRPYLRQQRGYGRSEALVEARHPDRFTATGTARWRGRVYDSFPAPLRRQRIYRGLYGAAAYQSVYRSGGYALDLLHQIGVPVAALLLLTMPLTVLSPWLASPAVVSVVGLVALGTVDAARVRPPRGVRGAAIRFRAGVVVMHLLQPIVRTWGRVRSRELARQHLSPAAAIPGPVRKVGNGVLLFPATCARADAAGAIVENLRRTGLRIVPDSGWEDHDARIIGSTFIRGDLVTSAHPIGSIQLRIRRRPRWAHVSVFGAATVLCLIISVWLGLAVAALGMLDAIMGIWRTGGLVRRTVRASATEHNTHGGT